MMASGESANWCPGQYTMVPFILDGKDYKDGRAPLVFNVIDTSNLADHVGMVNLLIATTPLLERNPWCKCILRASNTFLSLLPWVYFKDFNHHGLFQQTVDSHWPV